MVLSSATHSSKCFRAHNSVNGHSNPMGSTLWLTPFSRWGNWDIKRLGNLLKDIKLISGRVGAWTQKLLPESIPWLLYCTAFLLIQNCLKKKKIPEQYQTSQKTSRKKSHISVALRSHRLQYNGLFVVYLGWKPWACLDASRNQWEEKQSGRKLKSLSHVPQW